MNWGILLAVAPTKSAGDSFLWAVLGTGLFLLLAGIAWWWLRADQEDPAVTSHDLLNEFRNMVEAGTMTQAEFERVRARLGNQIRAEHGQKPAELTKLPPLSDTEEEEEFEWEEVDLPTDDPPSKPT